MNKSEAPDNIGKNGNRFIPIVKAGLYILLFYASQFAVAFVYQVTFLIKHKLTTFDKEAEELFYKEYEADSYYLSIAIYTISVLVCLLVYLIVRLYNKSKYNGNVGFSEYFHINKIKPLTAFGALVGGASGFFATAIAITLLQKILPESWMKSYTESMEQSGSPVVYYIILVIFAPIVEELIFRRFTVGNLNKSMPAFFSIAISSLVFGLAHATPIQMIYAFALGMIFGLVYNNTGSILTSMIMHFGFNAMNILVLIGTGENVPAVVTAVINVIYGIATIVSLPLFVLAIVFLLSGFTKSERATPLFKRKKSLAFNDFSVNEGNNENNNTDGNQNGDNASGI